jgi:fructose-specific phosphotransferase system IIC component
VDNGWFPIDTVGSKVGNTGTVTPGASIAIPIEGRFVIPPTAAISITVVGSLVGQTFTTGFSFYELYLPNE